MASGLKLVFCAMLGAQVLAVHAQPARTAPAPVASAPKASAAAPGACITRGAMRVALEEVMPPRTNVKPPPGVVLLPAPADRDCATVAQLKNALGIAQRKRW